MAQGHGRAAEDHHRPLSARLSHILRRPAQHGPEVWWDRQGPDGDSAAQLPFVRRRVGRAHRRARGARHPLDRWSPAEGLRALRWSARARRDARELLRVRRQVRCHVGRARGGGAVERERPLHHARDCGREAAPDHQAGARLGDVFPDHRDDWLDVPGAARAGRGRGRGGHRPRGGRSLRDRRPEGMASAPQESERPGARRDARRCGRAVPAHGWRYARDREEHRRGLGARALWLHRVLPDLVRECQCDLAAALRRAGVRGMRRQ